MATHTRQHQAHRLRSIADLIEREGLAAALRKEISILAPETVEIVAAHFEADEHYIAERLRRAADEIDRGVVA